MATSPAKRVHYSKDMLSELIVEARSWCGSNGLVMVSSTQDDGSWQHAPVALHPFAYSESHFKQALDLAVPFNLLVDEISRNEEFLTQTLTETVQGDPFTKRLLDLYKAHGGSRAVQPYQLGIHRSDYMVDAISQRLLQIELNTIASSFACLSARVTRLHRHLLQRPSHPVTDYARTTGKELPENLADKILPEALALAHEKYDKSAVSNRLCVILFVVQEKERNYVDQRLLEYELSSTFGISVLRLTLAQIATRTRTEPNTHRLVVDNQFEVSVVYFRAGYTPNDYKSEAEWEARFLLESSLCIKCPSIGYHLAGAKKIQQALALPNVLEQFVSQDKVVSQLRESFAGLWGLPLLPEIHEAVFRDSSRFVLKPQREGGGNNLYGEQVRQALESMSQEELASHILMERIFPKAEEATLMRNSQTESGPALCELGVYSVFLGNGSQVFMNKPAGHLLRCKFEGVDEGGVATGFSALSSPYLIE